MAPFVLCRPLFKRFGHPVMLVTGFVTMLLGALALYGTDASTSYARIAVGTFLIGAGSTFVPSAAASIVVSSTPGEQAGLASGVQNTLRQSGGLISVAIFGSILNTSDFVGRMGSALAVMTAAALLGIGSGLVAIRDDRIARQSISDNGEDVMVTASTTTNSAASSGRS
ncbi:MFS transporter [Streptomyces sp. NPDC051956]|uniref:MFS transporter n=1 Tax=Streptomyces sp. NPDC051956 TaxID=3365677 RepID=UPI0037D43BD5